MSYKVEKLTDKKYQHYVPKFYLRNFSNDGKSIGAYIFKNNKFINNASIKGIGGHDYLYGRDGVIEDWFSELEGKWSSIIRVIIENEKMNISLEEYIYLLTFIYLSDARSKNSANIMNNFINELVILTNKIDKRQKIKFDYKDNVASFNIPNIYPIGVMQDIIPILLDLRFVLIINNTTTPFISSDCIVTKYDQFLLERGFKRGYAYGTCGLECFLPISPKICFCLYDSEIYSSKKNGNEIIINDYKEINKLNKLFLYNSDEYIVFNNKIEKSRIDFLIKNHKKLKIDEDTIFKSEDGQMLLKFGNRCIDKNFNLNFLYTKRSKRKIRVNINMCAPIRAHVKEITSETQDKLPRHVAKKLENKKFYLERKE